MSSSAHTSSSEVNHTINSNANPLASRPIISFNIAAQAPLKLTASNYLSWRLQFTTLLTGYDLLGFVDGSHPCPEHLVTINDVATVNPAHRTWICQDQLILNAIIGSLTPSLISFIVTARTSLDAWSTFAHTYGKPTRGRITQLKTQLSHPMKGSKTITEFMQTIKIKADELALMNAPVDIEDLTITILQGLEDDYRELGRAIQARETAISFEELHEKLINHEAYLSAKKDTHTPLPVTANTAARAAQSHRSHYRAPNQSPTMHFRPSGAWTPRPSQPSTNRIPRPYLGRCQLCDEQGHSAKRCPTLKHNSWQYSTSSLPPPKLQYAGPQANTANHHSTSSD